MLDTLFTQKRSVVHHGLGGYLVRFTNGRSGPISTILMHSTPKLGQGELYKGPRVNLWKRQFMAES
jgi:hypothetical protein